MTSNRCLRPGRTPASGLGAVGGAPAPGQAAAGGAPAPGQAVAGGAPAPGQAVAGGAPASGPGAVGGAPLPWPPVRAVLLLLVLAAALLGAAPAHAATEPVKVALSDRQPADVTITAGDSVVFVNGESAPLGAAHQVTSATAPGAGTWSYDSGALAPGAQSAPVPFPQAGTFVYTDTRQVGVVPAASFTAKVVVQPAPAATAPAGGAATSSAARPTTRPNPPRTTAPAAALPQNRPSAGLPPGGPAAALPTAPAGGVPPAVAPLFGSAALPQTEPTVTTTLPPVQAVSGPLPGATASRGFGLAATLAAVAAGGVVSLLVRVLLADPAGRRPVLPVTVENPTH